MIGSFRWQRAVLVLLVVGLWSGLSACGAGSAPAAPTAAPAATTAADSGSGGSADTAAGGASAELGKEIFTSVMIAGSANGCGNCHYVRAAQGDLAGPNLSGIAERAATRVEGQTAEEYIRNSIVNPTAYQVEGWSSAAMPANYGALLSEEEIDSLVLYLLTLNE